MTRIFNKSAIDIEKLRQIILKNPQSVIEGLSFIDLQLETEAQGTIDFLGIGNNGRMVLMNFDVKETDAMILDLLAQSQWLKKNQSLIKRLFFSENVDFEQPQQLVLVCPNFSKKTMSAVKQLEKDITLIRYNYIASSDDDAIIFDQVYSKTRTVPVKSEKLKQADLSTRDIVKKQTVTSAESKPRKDEPEVEEEKLELPDYDMVSLTPEEIAEFMDFKMPVEQETAE